MTDTDSPAHHRSDGCKKTLFVMRIEAGNSAVRAALQTIDRSLGRLGTDAATRLRAQLVLGEICNNVVEHAFPTEYSRAVGRIKITCCQTQRGLGFCIDDNGRPVPDEVLPTGRYPPVDPEDLQGLPEGGFGWALVRDLADHIRYRRWQGSNLVQFEIT